MILVPCEDIWGHLATDPGLLPDERFLIVSRTGAYTVGDRAEYSQFNRYPYSYGRGNSPGCSDQNLFVFQGEKKHGALDPYLGLDGRQRYRMNLIIGRIMVRQRDWGQALARVVRLARAQGS